MIGRVALLLVMLVSAPAFAQSETGTRIGGRPAQISEHGTDAQRARIWLERYAACITRRDPKRVEIALDASPDSGDAALANLKEGYFDSCLSGGDRMTELRMSNAVLRGALYADRVGHMIRRLTPDMVAAKPELVPAATHSDAAAVTRIALLRFGDCVMRTDPANAYGYVAAHAESGMETKALAALSPSFSACVETGSTIKMSRSVVEAALAEAIYRTVRLPAATQNAGSR